jgi:hypothetical protein
MAEPTKDASTISELIERIEKTREELHSIQRVLEGMEPKNNKEPADG